MLPLPSSGHTCDAIREKIPRLLLNPARLQRPNLGSISGLKTFPSPFLSKIT